MRYVLGIDLGTSSIKAIVLCEDGSVAGVTSQSYPISVPQVGWAEQEPEDWWRATCAVITTVLRDTNVGAQDIQAIGIGGQMHGTVLLDDSNTPLRPAIIWPDQRATDEAADAERELRLRSLLPRLGGGISPGFMVATLLWCREHEPDTWRRTAIAILPKDYLRYRLTGSVASEPTDGSGVPMVDVWDRTWCRPALEALALPAHIFPVLEDSTAVAGPLSAAAARDTRLKEGTPVLYGGSDQAMGAVGAGLLEPGALLLSISTGGQLVTPIAQPLPHVDKGVRTLFHAIPNTYLALAATLGAGLSMRWLREEIFGERGSEANPRLLAQTAEAPPGCNGLLYLPYLAGERTPLLDPEASGAFIGLRLDHGRAHLARAVLEGVAFSLRHALEPLEECGIAPTRIILAGGLARSQVVQEIVADVLQRDVTPLKTAEQSAIGGAILAAVSAGFYSDVSMACNNIIKYDTPVTPNRQRLPLYQGLYERYRGLYPKLSDDFHALRRLGADREAP